MSLKDINQLALPTLPQWLRERLVKDDLPWSAIQINNKTSTQPNKTFSNSPPPTLLPTRDTFSHSRAFIKETKVILRVRRSTTWLTCLAEHRWTSEILDILPAFDTFRNKYLLKMCPLFFTPLFNLSLCHKQKTLKNKIFANKKLQISGVHLPPL